MIALLPFQANLFRNRSVTDSISHLLSVSVSGVVPGVADCDAELRRLEAMRPLLEYPDRPTNQHTYQLCVTSFAQSLAVSFNP